MKYAPPFGATDPDAHYVNADPAKMQRGSPVPAAAIEPSMREILAVIKAAGLNPSDEDLTQLLQAIRLLAFYEAENLVQNINIEVPDAVVPWQIGDFRDFFERTPPPGWAVRNGAVIPNADTACSELWNHLYNIKNIWKCKTLAEWEALSLAAGGVGGVPYFVIDVTAKSIKLPDTRGDYSRCAGSAHIQNVGAWHADQFQGHRHNNGTPYDVGGSGGDLQYFPGGAVRNPVYFNDGYNAGGCGAPRVGTETRTRAFGVLGCVYIGGV